MPAPPEVSSAEALRRVSFLADARPASIALLEQRCRRRTLRRGEFLFHEGEAYSRMFVIVRGAVSAVTTSAQGTPLTLHVAGPGETPGHLDLLERAPYSSSAMALGDVEVLVIAAADFAHVVDTDPAVLRSLAVDLAAIVRILSRSVTDLAFLDLPRRLARLLLDLADPDGTPRIVLTQGDLAGRLAAVRQSVNHALGLLARAGLITVNEAGMVTGADVTALRGFIDSAPR